MFIFWVHVLFYSPGCWALSLAVQPAEEPPMFPSVMLGLNTERRADCVAISSVSVEAALQMKKNSWYLNGVCDLIVGHYDLGKAMLNMRTWYQRHVVLGTNRKYRNKVYLVRDLVRNHQDILGMYKVALLWDADVDFQHLKPNCLVDKLMQSNYNIISPVLAGPHRFSGQRAAVHCHERVTDVLAPQIFMIKMSRLADLAQIVLPSTVTKDGTTTTDRGVISVMCRLLDNNTATGCGVVDFCGKANHTNTRLSFSLDPQQKQADDRASSRLYYQKYRSFWHANQSYLRCADGAS